MRRRLFWKILILFWLTFMIIVEGVWVVFALYGSHRKPLEVKVAERFARQQMATASAVLERGGIDVLRNVLAAWPAIEQGRLTVGPAPSAAAPGPLKATVGSGLPPLTATVRGPDQVAYRLVYDTEGLRSTFRRPGPLNIPLELVTLGLLGGLMFSAVLAWYLTKPIQKLRDGFSELSQGRLGVRLKTSMGRRRDELADLARDFDSMAERLQQLISSREQMLHTLSHELRSPLARLHMAVGLTRQDPSRFSASLDRIELEAKRLDKMVGDVLTLARAESGTQQMEDYFDLGGLALTVAGDARFEAQSSGVKVETGLEPGAREDQPTVKGNAELLRRALENVVRNALRHSAAGQTVRLDLSADRAARQFVIKVSDEGPGMEPQALQTFFEPFVRGQERQEGQGFGLGLAIAQRAVLAHGGSIEAQNRPGRGLMVTIRLPFGPVGSS